MEFAIVILNWNGEGLLKRFLPAVCAHSQGASVYLVDNASRDASVSWVRAQFQAVKVIQHEQNYGYAEGYNRALRQIQADVYCLLNSDVEVTPDWLTPFYHLFKKPEIAIAQPKILDYAQRDTFEYAGAAGGFIDRLAYPYCRGRVFFALEKDHGQYDDETPIFWSSGACLFVRSAVFHRVGGFDADYFAYQEEVDLCWRVHNHGYEVYYTGRARVYHIGGATLGNMSPKKTFLNFRNSLFNLIKNLPARKVPLRVLSRLVLDFFAAAYFLCKGQGLHAWAVFRAHLSFYRNFSALCEKRRESPRFIRAYYRGRSVVYSYFLAGKKHCGEVD